MFFIICCLLIWVVFISHRTSLQGRNTKVAVVLIQKKTPLPPGITELNPCFRNFSICLEQMLMDDNVVVSQVKILWHLRGLLFYVEPVTCLGSPCLSCPTLTTWLDTSLGSSLSRCRVCVNYAWMTQSDLSLYVTNSKTTCWVSRRDQLFFKQYNSQYCLFYIWVYNNKYAKLIFNNFIIILQHRCKVFSVNVWDFWFIFHFPE